MKKEIACEWMHSQAIPVDCMGLTKRWSLYVASHGNSRVRAQHKAKSRGRKPSRDLRDAFLQTHRLSVRAVASSRDLILLDLPRPKPRLEQPAPSLSHLTWS
jgi:hypothetical protein